ncbi:MAG: hypothetical protein JNJ43_17190 [Anaerolineales bacterium]|nr:hypothetical protein [Anaerolineales bacterium]
MNHQPFETWLLDDKHLTTAEKGELNAHLRSCKTCTALAETGLALRSAKMVEPTNGFTLRFQEKLAIQKVAERRRRLWGLIVLLISGIGLLTWFATPYIATFLAAPVEWLTAIVGYLIFIFTSLQALTDVFQVFTRMLPNFIPPYAWMILFSAIAGFSLLWTVSIWRFARRPQGVNV